MKMYYVIHSVLKLAFCAFLFTNIFKSLHSGENLAIFLPIHKSSKDIKKAFKQDPSYSKYRIVVYSKFKDLIKVNQSKNYQFIIAPNSFFRFNQAYKKKFTFQRDGKSKFRFQVITTSPNLNKKNYKDGIIALLDVTQRREAKDYVSYLLQDQSFKKIKRVSKLEDLFPVLVFNNAQYLLISPQNLNKIQSEYSSPIYEIDQSIKEIYPSIGIHVNSSFESLVKPSLSLIKQLDFSSVKEITREQK